MARKEWEVNLRQRLREQERGLRDKRGMELRSK